MQCSSYAQIVINPVPNTSSTPITDCSHRLHTPQSFAPSVSLSPTDVSALHPRLSSPMAPTASTRRAEGATGDQQELNTTSPHDKDKTKAQSNLVSPHLTLNLATVSEDEQPSLSSPSDNSTDRLFKSTKLTNVTMTEDSLSSSCHTASNGTNTASRSEEPVTTSALSNEGCGNTPSSHESGDGNVQMKRNHSISNPEKTNQPKLGSSEGVEERTLPLCGDCHHLRKQNAVLQRRVARLCHRVHTASETQQTHGQRILRAFYDHKFTKLNEDHERRTTHLLNRQKDCFREELGYLKDAREREATRTSRFENECARLASVVSALERDRDTIVQRSEEKLNAVQRKMSHLHARTLRLEREKINLEHTISEKTLLIDSLVATASAHEAEKRRVDIIARSSNDERVRKDRVIDALQTEVNGLRHRLSAEMEINSQLVHTIETVEGKRASDRARHDESLTKCRIESQKEADKLGRLIASVIQDFANAQSEVSTRSTDESVDADQEDSSPNDEIPRKV